LRPTPFAGAAWVSNGLAIATSRNAKNVATSASGGTTHGSRSAFFRRDV
jgi:hypothetical protein